MILDKGLCGNLLVVVYGVWPEYQPSFARAVLKARPEEKASKMMSAKTSLARCIHATTERRLLTVLCQTSIE